MPFDLEQIDVETLLQCGNDGDSNNTIGMKDFELLKVLGTGAYGKVYLTRKVTGEDKFKLYAMKVLKKETVTRKPKTKEHTITERKILENIRNAPFLMKLHYAFQTRTKLHLVLDYINGGELFIHLYRREKFIDWEVRFYIGEIAVALNVLHELDIIYRDLKLENILLDDRGHIVLTDFGLSKALLNQDEGKTYSFCGTLEYMSPELIRGQGHDFRIDWWSLGILTFELLSGASPFTIQGQGNSNSEVTRRILDYDVPMPSYFSPAVSDFISCLLCKEAEDRLLFSGIKDHIFYECINWNDLEAKQLKPPIIPRIRCDVDTSNFSSEFTSMAANDSPAPTPGDTLFKGYSFISPSVLFGDTISLLSDSESVNESDPCDLYEDHICIASQLPDSEFFLKYVIMMEEPMLGDGTYSVCRRCVHLATGMEYAVKIISKRYNVSREVIMLQQVQGHRNIVKLIEVLTDCLHTYIVMELLRGGELLTAIKRRKFFCEATASSILRQIVSAVQFLHSRNIIHRDLKPENLIFADDSCNASIHIVDFGFARYSSKGGVSTPCYTLPYVAPEVIDSDSETYDESCDLWSIGIIMFTMLTGRVPFQNGDDVIERIKRGQFSLDTSDWNHISTEAKTLIKGLLTVNTKERYTMRQVIDSEWLRCSQDEADGGEGGGEGGVGRGGGGRGRGTEDFIDEPSVLKRMKLNTPLLTPSILRRRSSSVNCVSEQITMTMKAFYDARKQGFRLQEVILAPLAQRRKAHRNTVHGTASNSASSSDDSSLSQLMTQTSQGFDVSLFEEEEINLLKRGIHDIL